MMGDAYCDQRHVGSYGLQSVGTTVELRQYVACFVITAGFDKQLKGASCHAS